MRRIILASSGHLKAMSAIPRFRDRYGADVVVAIVDLGQDGEIEALRSRAVAAGAARAHVLDAREEFASGYLLRALKAGVFGGGHAPVAGALARALVVSKLVELARAEQAFAIAHGANGEKGERFSRMVHALNPELQVIACVEQHGTAGDEVEPTRAGKGYPDGAAFIEIEFQRGVPVRVNGVDMPLLDLISSVTLISGIPAAALLHSTHEELQRLVTTEEAARFSRVVGVEYRDAVLEGLWFTPLREALDAYVEKLQERVTGTIRLKLFEGELSVVDRQSIHALDGPGLSADDALEAPPAGVVGGVSRAGTTPSEPARTSPAAVR